MLNFAKIISEDFMMYVYDQRTVIIQQIYGEGKAFADAFATQTFDEGTICTDAAFYREAFRLFVGCYSPDTAYIYTIDPLTAEIQYSLTISNHGIKNRLRMFISNFSSYTPDPYYLVIYDQIFDRNAPYGKNLFAHIVKNIDQRKPTFYNTADITGISGNQISDIFPYKQYTVVVARKSAEDTKFLVQCNYDLKKTIKCYNYTTKTTPVILGLVGLDQRYNRYYEVD